MEITRRTRPLYDWEIEEASLVFGHTLHFARVRIHEGAAWPDSINRVGRFLKRLPAPGKFDHNAVTLGNHCYFPVPLPQTLPPPGHPDSFYVDWLIHELTHAWQYQHTGAGYLFRALAAQFREGDRAYDFGGPDGLLARRLEDWKFARFNPEQQGNIAQTYYVALRSRRNVDAWLPYIRDIQEMV